MNPIDDFLEMHKTASQMSLFPTSLGQQARSFLGSQKGQELLGGAAINVGATAASLGAGVVASKIYEAINKRRGFKEMMELDPGLKELHEENPKFFNAVYTSLRAVNPTFGKDPLIAGAHMRKLMANGPESAGLLLAGTVSTPRADPGLSFDAHIGPMRYQRGF